MITSKTFRNISDEYNLCKLWLSIMHQHEIHTHVLCIAYFWNTELVAIMMETSRKLWYFSTFQQFKDHNYVTVIHRVFWTHFFCLKHKFWISLQRIEAHDASSERYKMKIWLITVYNHSNRQLKTRCYSEINSVTVRHIR